MDEDQVFIAEAIRDTANHDSTESESGPKTAKTIFIENGLNQTVTFQLQGGRNSTWIDVNDSFNIGANINDFRTVTNYFPKFRLKAICATAPTTGNLNVWIIRV